MKLYSGRLPTSVSPLMDEINRSLPFDIRLLPYDVATNRAWVDELTRIDILSESERISIHGALDQLLEAYQGGAFDPLPPDEDVHTLVERFVTEKVGDAGARIHTGRSRNDQVVCDLRLYTVDRLRELVAALHSLIEVLAAKAESHMDTLLAGTTHLQPALPITLGQFLASLAFALVRDSERCREARGRTALCPLGAGAMAGSGFPVNRERLASALGFDGILWNSVDAVSDRDFCQEVASVCGSICGHLSRYAEQFIFWANPAFGYVRFSNQWSTGSSMMPQKRNPDAMELIRGKTARIIGSISCLFTLTKGLPLSYAKDLQEDKQPLFDVLDTTELVLKVFTLALDSAEFDADRMERALSGDMLATDLADALTLAGVPFREAHERVGHLVSEFESESRDLLTLGLEDFQAHFPELADDPPNLTFKASVARRNVAGGTSIERVSDQISRLRCWLKGEL